MASKSDIIHHIQHEIQLQIRTREEYEDARAKLLDYADAVVDQERWKEFHQIQAEVERLDKEWAPPGGWPRK